ncbi:hypothetical protein TKK_0006075 [Trichogramma kaykai]
MLLRSCILFSLSYISVISCQQVKITSAQLNYLNLDYININTYSADLKKVNSTYTALPLHWGVIQDFPKNTLLITEVIRYKDSSLKEERGRQSFVVKICDKNDPYRKALPPFLLKLTEEGNCIKKGEYEFSDAGQFQFYKILPEEVITGYYFDTVNWIKTDDILIKKLHISSKSNK